MIAGFVSSQLEPLVQVTVSGPGGHEADVEALIDTGFDGWLTLPLRAIKALNLRWLRSGRMLLADGTETLFDVYDATIQWDGAPRQIRVDQVESEPLMGMALLEGSELRIEVRVGGNVTIEPVP